MTPLYNHTSQDTAYLVNDYPYSFKLRCRIRYWLEHKDSDSVPLSSKGFRFVSQTENPKTLRWNAPKPSTYCKIAGAMYLDENNHVQWTGVSEYTDAERALQFAKDFPQADCRDLRIWAKMKAIAAAKFASGEIFITVNGQKNEMTQADKDRHLAEEKVWREVADLLKT